MLKKIMNVLSVLLLIILIAVVLFLFVSRIMGETPSLFGYYVFRVSSDSMEPTLMVGDVILVKSVDAEDIGIDDIITYKSKDGSMYGREVTHRVVSGPLEKKGKYFYQTQGDAIGAPLDKAITYDQIEGKFIRKLTVISLLYGALSTPIGVAIFVAVIIALFGYELISLLVSYKKIDEVDLDSFESKQGKNKK